MDNQVGLSTAGHSDLQDLPCSIQRADAGRQICRPPVLLVHQSRRSAHYYCRQPRRRQYCQQNVHVYLPDKPQSETSNVFRKGRKRRRIIGNDPILMKADRANDHRVFAFIYTTYTQWVCSVVFGAMRDLVVIRAEPVFSIVFRQRRQVICRKPKNLGKLLWHSPSSLHLRWSALQGDDHHRYVAFSRYRLVIGSRRSRPKAREVIRGPGAACRRLYSAQSTLRSTSATIAGS